MSSPIPPPLRGPRRILRAAKFSMEGIGSALLNEQAFRTEFIGTMLLAPVVAWMEIPASYRVLVWMSMGLVLVVELLNSSIEAVVDKVSPEYHPLAKRAKDMGSAAVFVTLLLSMIAWGLALLAWWSHSPIA